MANFYRDKFSDYEAPLKVIRRGWNAIKYFLTERGKGNAEPTTTIVTIH